MKEKIFKGITWWFALQCLTNILEQRYFRDLSKKKTQCKTRTYILYYQTNNKLNS